MNQKQLNQTKFNQYSYRKILIKKLYETLTIIDTKYHASKQKIKILLSNNPITKILLRYRP